MRFRLIFSTVLLVLLLFGVAASAAGVELPFLSTTILSGKTDTITLDNPYGCFGQSDNPHQSVHDPTQVNAQARTECDYYMPYVKVTSQLHYQVWWGWDCKKTNSATRDNAKWVETQVNSDCLNGWWRITSYHEALGPDELRYYGNTMNETTDLVCYGSL
jgi:hypothetical protein